MFRPVAPVVYTIIGPPRLADVTIQSRPKFPVQNSHEAGSERCFERFPKQMRLMTIENSYCSWINGKKRPSNKAKYFITLMCACN
jgi:hypothetical protein